MLYPRRRGEPEPKFLATPDGGVRVFLGRESDVIHAATPAAPGAAGQVVVTQNGQQTVLLKPGTVPALPRAGGLNTPGVMMMVPAGVFDMGDTWEEGFGSERPVHTVYLSSYEISKFEVLLVCCSTIFCARLRSLFLIASNSFF